MSSPQVLNLGLDDLPILHALAVENEMLLQGRLGEVLDEYADANVLWELLLARLLIPQHLPIKGYDARSNVSVKAEREQLTQ